MERKKIMTWTLMWLNVSATALNAMLQLLVIYIDIQIIEILTNVFKALVNNSFKENFYGKRKKK